MHPAVETLVNLDAPVVVAVQGSAAGAGLGLVLAADLVIAARSAKFVMAFTAIGLSPDASSSWFLPRIVGQRRALELTLMNRVLSAAEAHEWGIVTSVVDDDALFDAAAECATTLAAGPTAAFGRAARLRAGRVGHDPARTAGGGAHATLREWRHLRRSRGRRCLRRQTPAHVRGQVAQVNRG